MSVPDDTVSEDDIGEFVPVDTVITNLLRFDSDEDQIIYTETPNYNDMIALIEHMASADYSLKADEQKLNPEQEFKRFVVPGQDHLGFSQSTYRKAAEHFLKARTLLGIDQNARFRRINTIMGMPKGFEPQQNAAQEFAHLIRKKYKRFTKSKQAKAVFQLSEEGIEDTLICAMLGIKLWQLNRYKQILSRQSRPYTLPKKKIDFPFQKYYRRVEPKAIAWFLRSIDQKRQFESCETVKRQIFEELGIQLSVTALRRLMKTVFHMKYKKVVQLDTRANFVDSKRKRQLAGFYFARAISKEKEIINIDESSIQLTHKRRRAWGIRNERIVDNSAQRLNSIHIIAAISNHGRGWFRIGFGKNNSSTFSHFVMQLCKELQVDNPDWRKKTVLLLDNARYHKSKFTMEQLETTGCTYLFLGPYSFDVAPIEKVFANIKKRDLNPANIKFENRKDKTYFLRSLAAYVAKMDLGDFRGYFRNALLAAEEHFMFQSL